MNIGDRLRRARLSAGYESQARVADELGIDRTRYLKWEHDDARPSLEMLASLCKMFGVSADYLLGLIEEPRELSGQSLTPDEVVKLRRLLNSLEEWRNETR